MPRARAPVLVACAVLAGAARAEEPDPHIYASPRADLSPTAYACTVETLQVGRPCVFEGRAPSALSEARQAEDNARSAAALADQACRRAARLATEARPDGGVLAACKTDFVGKAAGCAARGSEALLDEEGRFTPPFRACYAGMAEVLARTRLMASATGGCCRCLVAAGCLSSGELCNRQLAAEARGPSRCMARSCASPCEAFLPPPPPPPDAAAGARPADENLPGGPAR